MRLSAAHVLTRAIGHSRNTKADATYQDTLDGDIYLLCSDGLAPEVSDQDIVGVLSIAPTLKTAATYLIECAAQRGGKDNCTVVLVRVKA